MEAVKIGELQAADKIEDADLFVLEQNGEAKKLQGNKLLEYSSGGNHGAGSGTIPRGLIAIWSGDESDIPDGWHLCDGEDGTPDLRDKFVLGAGINHKAKTRGGAETVTLTTSEIPYHTHTYSESNGAGYAQGVDINASGARLFSLGSAKTGYTSGVGSGKAHENMPPYYALCYIMKM